MVKRLLTFALSVGFFIWLPNAFADGNGILSLDAPTHIRQTQNDAKDLLTLRVDNIQVRAEWRVDNVAGAFDIADGVLQLKAAETSGLGTQVVTIYVEDKFDLLNDSYVNLTASAVITVEFKSGEFGLSDAPLLTAVAGEAGILHTFSATGGSEDKTYTLVAGDERYFSVNATSGVLSLQASVQAGVYTLTVQVADDNSSTVVALATVEVSAALMLADAPLIYVALGSTVSLHKFIASGGIGIKTYALTGEDKGYFSVDAGSGVLFLLAGAQEGVHTLTVQAIDVDDRKVNALATVRVSAALMLLDAPSFTVIASMAMSLHTFIASGGIGTPTYAILAGNEKGGFTLNAASGVLSLQAGAEPGAYVLTVRATDEHLNIAEAVATVGVSAVLSLADAQRLVGAQGVTVSLHTFVAQGGIGSRTYTLVAGDAEVYFSLDAESGVLSLLAASVGIYTLSVQVIDDRGNAAYALAMVEVRELFLASAGTLYAIEGRAVSLHTFAAQGGTDVTYTLVADNEEYFTLGMNNGVLSVLADVPIGIYTLSVQVEDGDDNHAEATAIVEVRASLSLVAMPPLTVIVGRVAHTLAASGGIGTHTYAIESGDEGVFVLDAASGVLSLRADAALGRHTLTLQVADARANTVQAVATVEVSAALALSDAPPFTVIASVAVSLHKFIASGGIGIPTYAIVSGNEKGHFDLGAASGVLSLAADAEPDTYVLRIQVTDARDNTDEAVATVGVSAMLSLVDAPRLTAVAGEAVNLHTFSAKGGIGTKTYTLMPGDDVGHFGLDKNSGVLSLQASAQAGVYTLTVQVADADDGSGPVEAVATVEVSAALMLADAPLLSVVLGAAVSLHKFTASGGIGIKTYTLAAGDKGYFSVNANSGVLSLLATAQAGVHMITVQAIDGRNVTVDALATVKVSAALMLADAPPFTVIASAAMSLHTFIASGGIGTPTYTIVASNEKGGFTLNAASGVLSLQADVAVGIHTLTVQVMDARDNTAQAVATVEVSAALALAEAPSFTVIASVGMSLHTFIASGGIGSRTYTLLAGDKNYFSVGADSGVLSLSVNAEVGRHTLTVQAMDAHDNTAQAVVMVEVSAVLALADAPSFTVVISAAMSLHTFIASGGIGTPTYTILAGNEKGGFTLNAASGVLSLQADAEPDNYVLRIQAMDERDNTAEALATVGVSAVLILADAPRLGGSEGIPISLHMFEAQGGIGARTYTLLTDDVEDYFSLGAESGVLSLLASATVGVYTLSVQVKDDRGNVADALATVGVDLLFLSDALLYAIVGREVSLHTFDPMGVEGALTYTITAGNNDGYFNLDADHGVLSVGANAPIGIYTLSVLVKDGRSEAEALAVVEVRASLSLVTVPPLTVVVDKVAHTLAASGGIGTHTYAIVSGDDDGGFALDAASGALSLRADAALGRHTLTLQVADARKNTVQAVATVEVSAALALSDAPPFTVIASVAMSLHTFIASGGIGVPAYTIVSGNEKGHFDLGATSGVLSLAAGAEPDTYVLRIQATDARDNTDEAVATVGVSAVLSLSDAPRLTAVAGEAMSLHTFSAKGGIGNNTYTLVGGDDADYFDLDKNSGVLSLLASAQEGMYTLTVQVADADGGSGPVGAVATVEVSAALMLADAPLLSVALGAAVSLHKFTASGGIGIKTYTLAAGDKGYFSVNADNGVLSLLATAQAGVHMVTVQAIDEGGRKVEAMATVGVSAALMLADAPPFTVIASMAMSLHMFIASGGIGVKTYTLVAGDDGEYFSVDAASGVLSLSINAPVKDYMLTVQVMDEHGNTDQVMATVGVSAVLSLAEVSPLTIIVGDVSHAFVASGGIGVKTYTITGGDGEGYFALDVISGILSLSADAPAKMYTLTVRAKDERNNIAELVAMVEVSAVLALADAPSFTVIASAAMNLHTFIASGGIGVKTYTLLAGDDKGYFAVDAASGVLALSVNAPVKDYMLTVQVMDEQGNTAQAVAMVEVSAFLSLADSPLLEVIVGDALNLHTFVAGGGIGSRTYTLLAGNDGYFSVGADSGVLSLSAGAEVGRHTLTVQVMDARDNTAQAVATVGVSAVLALAAPPLTVIASAVLSLHTFASGGIGSRTYTLLAGDKNYFSVGADSGVLSVNAEVGRYTLTVQVMDARGNTAQAVVMVEVSTALVLADAPSFTVIISAAVSLHTFVASGGIGTPTYAVVAGNEAGHFTLNATSGLLSLQADAEPDIYVLRIQAMDAHHNTAEVLATVGVSAVLSLADAPRLGGAQGIAVSLHTFAAQGGIGSRTYTLLAGEVEGYFSLDAASGVLSLLTVAPVATYTLSVQVKDERGNVADALATVGVVPLYLADAPPLYAVVGREVSLHAFAAKGVIGTLTYTIAEGDVNSYFNLDADHGVLSVGADAPIGIYTLSVSVSDNSNSAEALAVVEVRASLSLVAVPPLTVIVGGVAHTLVASGGIGIPTYAILVGNTDGHFALGAASGVLSLRADAALGRHTLTLQVADARTNTVQAVVTVGVSAVLVLADRPLLEVIAGDALSLHIFAADGGIGSRTYTLLGGDDGYFSVNAGSGVLSLSADAGVGRHTLTVQVMDEQGNTAQAVAMVGVSAVLALAEVPLLEAIAGNALNLHTFAADGGIGSRTYTLLAGDDGYFSVGAGSGVLFLSADAAVGRHTLTVQVMDGRDNTAQAVATVGVSAVLALAAPSFTVIASAAMNLHTFIASGGIGIKTYTLMAGDDEGYFSVDAASGVLALSVNAPVKEYMLTVQVMDERGNTAQAVAMVRVSAVLLLADSPLLEVIAGDALNLHTFVAGGGIGSSTYTLLAGDEGYFSVGAESGVLSLSADAAVGRHTLTVQVMDERDNTAQAVATVGVSAVLALAAPPFTVIASVAMSLHTFIASGGIGIRTYSLLASDDDGYFSVDAASGVFSLSVNTPAKDYMLTVQVMDERGSIAQAVATVGVSVALVLAEAPPFTVIATVAVSLHTFIASGGIGTPTYAVVSGNEAGHFTLNATSGLLSLQADAEPDTYVLRIQAMDAHHNTAETMATVGVSAVLSLADAPRLGGAQGIAFSLYTFAAQGGIGSRTYTLLTDNVEDYFSLDAESGVLSLLTVAPVGTYTLSVQVKDERGNVADALATVGVVLLFLADAPPLFAVVGREVSLHTFAAKGVIGTLTYTIAEGDVNSYFDLDADHGVLSVGADAPIGIYTLSVSVSDERSSAQALVVVEVRASLSLAAVPPLTVIVGGVAHTLVASGGIGTPIYVILEGNKDGYFALDAASGVLSLRADAALGRHTLTLVVADARTNIAQAVVTVGVSAVLVLAEVPLLEGIAGDALSLHTFVADGGIGSRTYTLLAGDDGYFSVNAGSGVLSLSADAAVGRHTLTVQVMDGRDNTAQAVATVGVSVALVLAEVPSFTVIVSVAMSLHTFVASGGVGVKTYTLRAGDDGKYFSVDAASGVLSLSVNAPTKDYMLTVQAIDEQNNIAQVVATVGVSAVLSLAAAPLLEAIAGDALSLHTLVADGGIGSRTYTLLAGDDGYFSVGAGSGVLSLSANAALGRHTLTVQVMDGRDNTAQAVVTVGVSAALVLADRPLLEVIAGDALSLHTFVAGGGIGSRTYTLLAGDDGYFSVGAESGVLSLSAAAAVGRHTLTVQVMDGRGNTDQAVAMVGVSAVLALAAPPFTVIASVAMSLHTFIASGGIGIRTYTLLASDDDGYFSVDAASGVFSLSVNTLAKDYRLTVQVMDERGSIAQAVAMVGVSVAMVLAEVPPFKVIASVAMSLHTFVASGGIGVKTYTLAAGDDGEYFSVDAASGVFSLSMNAPAKDYRLTVQVMDEHGNIVQVVATVGVSAVLALTDAPLLRGTEGEAEILYTFEASGGLGANTYTVVAGAEYFSVGAASGVLSVDASVTVGIYTLSVQVADVDGNVAPALATVKVAFLLLRDVMLYAIVGREVSLHTFEADGGEGEKFYFIVGGNVPQYFTLDAGSGVLSADGDAPVGVYTLSMEARDTDGNVSEALAVVAVEASLFLADAPPVGAVVGMTMSVHTFAAGGGIGAKTYTLAAEGQEYFAIDAASGVLSAVNAPVGIYTLSVTVSDSRGNQAQARGTVEVVGVLSLADVSLDALARLSVTVALHTFTAGGGYGTKRYEMIADESGYFAFDVDSGKLSLPNNVAMREGTYALSVEVSDSLVPPQRATSAVMVRIAKNGIFVLGGHPADRQDKNDAWWSAGGGAWKRETAYAGWDGRKEHQAVVYQGRLYVLGGVATSWQEDDVWSSADGKSWWRVKDAAWPRRGKHQTVVHNGRMYVMGGKGGGLPYNDVWSSADGKNWTEETAAAWSGRIYHQAVVHNGRMYVLGGDDGSFKNDVWSSADGNSWMLVTMNAAWTARSQHQAVSHNGRLYILGGYAGGNFNNRKRLNDVWSSADGKSWRQELANDHDFWSKRELFQAVSRDGLLYVLGGGWNIYKKDVWSSADGKSWTKVGDGAWSARWGFQSVVFPSPLILSGTSENINLILGVSAAETRTFTAQYGFGAYTYSLTPENTGFNIDSNGVLSMGDDIQTGAYVIAVQVRDEEGSLAQIDIEVEAIPLVSDAPTLFAIAGKAENLHTFVAIDQAATYTYAIVSGDGEGYFTVGAASGLLSLSGEATVGLYTLSVEISDSGNSRATARATVDVRSPLSLAEALPLTVTVGMEYDGLHIFAAQGGFGPYTYTLLSGNDMGYFVLDESSGNLLLKAEAAAGLYTLMVQVSDSRGNQAQAQAVVRGLLFLSWLGLPPLPAIARLSVEVTLHTAVVHGAVGTITYAIAAGNDMGYFAFDADSGVLSLPVNGARLAGDYTLLLAMSDGAVPPRQATAAVVVRLVKNGIFVLGGASNGLRNDVWSSADGESWRQDKANNNVGWTRRQLHQAVAHNGRLYVLGGADGSKRKDVWWSVDGANWQRETDAAWTGREIYQAVSYNGRIYVLGGLDDGGKRKDVWSSADGENWDLVTVSANWTARDRHQAVVHNGRIWLLGGQDSGGGKNDVWSSANGSSWRFEGDADWDARYFHQAVSHAGRLYVLGGSDGNVKSDVWSSVDGRSWVEEKADNNVFWSQRYRHQSLSRDGLLYVLGGQGSGGRTKDVWSSADGRSWTKVTDAAWSARMFHQALVFPPNLVLSGTSETIILTLQVKSEIYPFSARYGFGEYTYSLLPKVPGFDIDGSSGVLLADGSAAVGGHTLIVQVEDEEDSRAQTEVNIEVISVSIAALELADAPSFVVVAGAAMSLHTFIASGGLGAKTYTLVAGEEAGIFMLDAKSGVLSVVNAPAGFYTLSVQVSDSASGTVQVGGTVEVVAPLSLQVPPLTAWVRLSAAVALHMLTASGGYEAKTYTIIAGNEAGYFAVGESSGELSLLVNGAMLAGNYTLSVAVSDGLSPPQRATAAVTVRLVKNGIFVLGGAGVSRMNDVWSSVDGAIWMQEKADNNEGWPAREEYQVVFLKDRLYALGGRGNGGSTNDVWSSADGRSWVEVTTTAPVWSARREHQAVVHNGRIYVLGGLSINGRESDVWWSVDGKNWTEETAAAAWSGRYSHQAAVHNGRMYVVGGYDGTRLNDVWSSVNGKNWTLEKEHDANWIRRTGHQVVSHNGRLYLLGGINFGGKNDVWSSVDGKSWRLEKEDDNNQWPRRYRHQVVSRYGEMYVLGGNGSFLNDVWSSVDGKSWQEKKAHNNEGWSDREYHQAIVFPPTLLLSGQGEMNYVALSVSSEIHTFQAQYGFGQYTYSLTPNVPGFGIDESSGLLSADGNASIGNYTLTVWVQDEENSQAQTAVKVDVALSIAALVLADAPLFMVITGVATNLHTFIASGGIGAKTYNLVDGQGYFTLGESSGILSVQADSEEGVYTLSVEVSDGGGSQATARATVEVAPFLLADVMLYAIVGREVSLHIFETEGGSEAAKTYAIVDGNDDDYFTLDASGVLSVQGNAPVGIYTLFVAADGEGGYRAEGLAVVAVEASLFLADMPLLTAVAGVTMSLHTFAASGGIGAKTYTLAATEGQGYFILNAASGLLSAANAAVGFYTLSVTVSDSRGNSAQARGTVEVVAPLFLADAPPLEALARLSVTVSLHTFAASGGIGSKRYAVIADETDYFAIDVDSGELSLPSNSAMLAGAYTLRVEASDSLSPQRATAAATVQIARNGIFVLGGNESQSANNDLQNDVWSSVDGESWRENTSNAGWTARESHQVVAHRGRMYLMGGFEPGVRNDVWSSADGVTWREDKANNSAGWSARGYHQALVHNGRMYVLGGNDTQNRNDVWSSADGVNWNEETGSAAWSERQGLQAVSHNGRLYVLGGYGGSLKNDVWSSADGASWRFEGNAEWTGRWLYKAVSHNGRLYILGGNDGDRRNDVWSSLDGRSWEEEPANNNAVWTKRGRHQALSRDGLLYVLGGNDGSLRRDVWSSADGKNWTEETAAAGWLAREYHQALVFPPNLVLSGTSETITLTVQAAIYTLSAQYGVGQYTYSLTPEIEGINIDGAGVLSADNQAQVGAYEVTVRVEDEEGGHAETIIKVDLRFLALADASPLFAIAGLSGAVILHTFTVIYGVAPYTYSLADESGYFILSEESGALLMLNNVPVGTYTLSVAVEGADGSRAQEVVLVTVGAALYLAPAYVLAEVGVTMSLDTFAASGGFGAKTYTLSAGNELGYFSINATSGVLSVVNAAVGYYFLSVRVSDSKDFSGGTQIIVQVVDLPPLSLADAPPLEALARLSVAVSLHSFIASGGYSEKRYAIIAGNQAGYFAVGETSGVLSLPSDSTMMAGHYTLSVEVSDSFVPPQRATAIATVLLEKNRVFVMGGRRVFFSDGSSDVWSSADVEDWRQVTASADWTNRELYQAVSHNGKIYVMGGEIGTQIYLNDVWSSVDGKNWSFEGNAGWSKRRGFQAVSHNGKIYVLGGYGIVGIASREYLNDVWSSVDGKNWSSEGNADWLTRERFQAVSHNGTIYVLGGEDDAGDRNDVWSSVDGASWEKEPAVGWAVRNSHQAVSHNGTIYVLGGVSGGNNGSRKHDVWSSVDGKTWEQKTAAAAWSARFGHQVLSRDGRMYVLGGNHSQSLRYNNEVWSSADGVSWKQESTAAWEARHNHQAVIFP